MIPHRQNSLQRQEGMALPMVLWAVAILVGVTLLLAGIIEGWINEETHAGKQFRARQQALSGLALAMNPAILPGDPILSNKSGDEGYKVEIKDESGLINPNTLLAAVPDRRDILRKLFSAWGLTVEQCDAAVDGLYDWQSPTPLRSLNGAKQPQYAAIGQAGLPPNAPFSSPDEMGLVIGFGPVMDAKPEWRTYFTTYYDGKINVLHAPKGILTDLIGLTPDQADQWITLRNGKDGIEGTSDDLSVSSLAQAASLMGANGAQTAVILDICDITGSVRRIESTGTCNGVSHKITVIFASGENNPNSNGTLLGWSE